LACRNLHAPEDSVVMQSPARQEQRIFLKTPEARQGVCYAGLILLLLALSLLLGPREARANWDFAAITT